MTRFVLVNVPPFLSIPVYGITETRLLPAKTQRFIEFLRESLDVHDEIGASGPDAAP
jgi:hypothetical protein